MVRGTRFARTRTGFINLYGRQDRMPVVSRFFGILIAFYWEDHLPPHFHAKYSGDEAVIDIRSGKVLNGVLPKRALSMVDEWRRMHVEELMANWERAHRREPLSYIDPLE